MNKKLLLLVMAALLSAGLAAAQDVRYNFDKGTDFSKYKTYTWVTLKDAQPLDNLLDKQIKAAIDTELAGKGLTKSDAPTADLLIGYQGAIGQEKEFTSYGTDWGYGPGWYRGGWYGSGMTSTRGQTSTIYMGTLALDMYDSAQHDLVWRGIVSKTIDQQAKPDKQQKNLQKAVKKLLKNYPPATSK